MYVAASSVTTKYAVQLFGVEVIAHHQVYSTVEWLLFVNGCVEHF
jgi:hypothetical protein